MQSLPGSAMFHACGLFASSLDQFGLVAHRWFLRSLISEQSRSGSSLGCWILEVRVLVRHCVIMRVGYLSLLLFLSPLLFFKRGVNTRERIILVGLEEDGEAAPSVPSR